MLKLLLLIVISLSVFADTNQELSRKIDILAEEIARLKAGLKETPPSNLRSSMKVYDLTKTGFSIGGYGEVIYTNSSDEDERGNFISNEAQAEALRNVIYLGYKFNEKWIFNSEIEIEHVNKIYNEFMYLDYIHSDTLTFRSGFLLVPMGFTNMLHEPIFFPTVNRSDIEKFLIPTTWRELGLGILGFIGKLSYGAYLFNGPDAGDLEADSGLRGGRKKGGADGDNDADKNASTGVGLVTLQYDFSNTFMMASSLMHGNASGAQVDNVHDLTFTTIELRSEYKYKRFKLRGLYVQTKYHDVDEWNEQASANDLPESYYGYYLEGQYNISIGKSGDIIPFFRYERYDLNDEVASGYTRDRSLDRKRYIVGMNYKPLPQIVFKLDYTKKENKQESGIDEFNMGLGYTF